jgi:EAL domain-containing protein (putative c-di-GMP-specific phosphodiesterase class I)/GGDEF domain-containing protein
MGAPHRTRRLNDLSSVLWGFFIYKGRFIFVSIRVRNILIALFSTAAVLMINNVYFSYHLTGFLFSFYKHPFLIGISFLSLGTICWIVYLVVSHYSTQGNTEYPNKVKETIEGQNEPTGIKTYSKLDAFQTIDHLTGLPNREQMRAIARSMNTHSDSILILSVFLVRSYRVSVIKGPEILDEIILKARDRLTSFFPSKATIGRLNINQFSIILPLSQGDNGASIVHIAQSLKNILENSYTVNSETYFIKCQIGISLRLKGEDYPLSQLLHSTDLAVVEGKKEISPDIFAFNPYLNHCPDILDRETALYNAIKRKELKVVYQPIVNLNNQTISLETLVRWNYQGNWIPPEDFIPIVEELGLMEELTLHVAEFCAQDWSKWKSKLNDLTHLSINVSPSIFKNNNGNYFLAKLLEVLTVHKVPPHNICFEITENVLLSEEALPFMKRCIAMGFLLAVDDFGTGYSSMSYLTRYPFTILKMDRSFIESLESDAKQQEVARSIIQLAKGLNMNVVAEGVETETQLRILKEMGVHAVQGYYFSQPQFIDKWDPNRLNEKRAALHPIFLSV